MPVNVLELFAGIGGMGLGLERAGMTVIGQVEIDPFCTRVLERHWPEVPRHDDVRTALAWWDSEPRPRVDVVAGGYPCQGESSAGRRRGVDDERWLWPEMARIIHGLRPRWVIGENVLGHRTRGLRFVLRDLERLGYAARAGIISASEMGAPHRRARIFVLAELADAERITGQPCRTGNAEQGPGRRNPGRSGSRPHVADADREIGRPQTRDAVAGTGGATTGERAIEPGGRGSRPHVADAERAGLPVSEQPAVLGTGRGPQGRAVAEHGWWAAEPDVGRVAHGVSRRVDRLRSLGNACVPQVAEYVGRLLLDGSWKH